MLMLILLAYDIYFFVLLFQFSFEKYSIFPIENTALIWMISIFKNVEHFEIKKKYICVNLSMSSNIFNYNKYFFSTTVFEIT